METWILVLSLLTTDNEVKHTRLNTFHTPEICAEAAKEYMQIIQAMNKPKDLLTGQFACIKIEDTPT